MGISLSTLHHAPITTLLYTHTHTHLRNGAHVSGLIQNISPGFYIDQGTTHAIQADNWLGILET